MRITPISTIDTLMEIQTRNDRALLLIASLILVLGCRHTATPIQMRSPEDPYRMGEPSPDWSGSASIVNSRLQLEFPGIEPDNVGCAAVDSTFKPYMREYYWLATLDYPDSHYPLNHFQQVVLRFALSPNIIPTRSRLDSVFRARQLVVREAQGDPPMDIHRVEVNRGRAVLSSVKVAGRQSLRVRLTIEDTAAIKAFLSPNANFVSLGWCQRDQWLTTIEVPLQRSPEVPPQHLPETR